MRSVSEELPLFPRGAIDQSIPQRFEEQVRKYSSKPALVADGVSLSFDQLNRAANCLARQILERRGVGQETVVLLMRQGAPFVVAVLAALKAGKIYVPLDPDDPAVRIAAMTADADAVLIVTDEKSQAAARRLVGGGVEVLRVEIAPDSGEPNSGIDLPPDRPAYIYYTSGSTGEPKGVVDTHRNVLHNVMRYTNSLKITTRDRLTLLQAPSFSGVVSSLFAALLNGATVYPYDLRANGITGLAEWMRGNALSIYHSVPSIFRALLAGAEQFPDVRVIRLEGDQALPLDVELYRAHFSEDCILVNGLGTTETGLCRQFFVDGSTELRVAGLPIGYPVEDMEVLLLDGVGHQVGHGASGEIAVRSHYLAQGYWRRPELTAARFVADGNGNRIYRTGDVGRWLARDCLLHLGRVDSQAKVRGFRVDLGEVEGALRNIDGVKDAAVGAEQDVDGESLLVGYVVRDNGSDVTPADLRERLSEKLPGYMAPGCFVFLDELPLTQHGKVDRRALAALASERLTRQTSSSPPRTLTEEQLAAIWKSLLRVETFSINDNFFDLGGHSLLAMRMLVEVEKKLGARLLPGRIMEAPTVWELARLIDEPRTSRSLVELQPLGSGPAFVWLPGADGNVFVFKDLARALGPDVPVYSFEPAGLDGESTPIDSVKEIAARYVDELLRARPEGPYCLGGYCFGGFVAYEMAKQLEDRGRRVPLLTLLDCDGEWRTISGWRDAFRYHLANLARQRVSAWPRYCGERLSYRWEALIEPVHRFADSRRQAKGRPSITATAQRVIQASRRASRGYTPTPWSGRLTHLQSRQRAYADPSAFWSNLVSEIDVHKVDGSDATIFSAPGVTRLAEILRVIMHDALATDLCQPPLIAATK